jgi:hypothetical protein
VPVHVPAEADRTCPSAAVPEIVGGDAFDGATPVTVEVGAETAVALPALFVAVTATTSVAPTSAGVTAYVDEVAPEIGVHAPEPSHRRHS